MDYIQCTHHTSYPAIQQYNHSGRSVLITGASRGIGCAIAISFAKAGASTIVLVARSNLDETEDNIVKAAAAAGRPIPKVLKLNFDICDETSVTAAARDIAPKLTSLDVLVNNAGYLETWRPIAESNPADWWHSWEINVKGAYLMMRTFVPLLLQGTLKTIINISSIGILYRSPGSSAYQTSKLALLQMSEIVSNEYSEQGLVIFCLHPGGAATELALRMPEALHEYLVDDPSLAGDTIAWLAQERRPWLNGRFINANWDMSELLRNRKEIEDGDKLKLRVVF
ncbi:hypothetical protein ASPVEDRAFT_151576 [Aspergillus versicolor CBS 583.65]|uniref:Uncharacterized protein n=1 Tax=Aspergillus versicolor CBS 583.65 TaxID=1036611 RepID=A0A1L9PN82_ASPVE|nr:uncharacterized protein ASPVEDRAFT_151576 [Aspergillus versicolor CBS 583.65]OJJ02989.1 hypothetical protein ASPVEDRAFT_151576 [Aspergillus versicolor CBS 583.65]